MIFYMYIDCPRAKKAWNVYSNITGEAVTDEYIKTGPPDKKNINLYSLVKHVIYCQRHEMINDRLLETRILNRVSDMNIVRARLTKSIEEAKNQKTLFNPG